MAMKVKRATLDQPLNQRPGLSVPVCTASRATPTTFVAGTVGIKVAAK